MLPIAKTTTATLTTSVSTSATSTRCRCNPVLGSKFSGSQREKFCEFNNNSSQHPFLKTQVKKHLARIVKGWYFSYCLQKILLNRVGMVNWVAVPWLLTVRCVKWLWPSQVEIIYIEGQFLWGQSIPLPWFFKLHFKICTGLVHLGFSFWCTATKWH